MTKLLGINGCYQCTNASQRNSGGTFHLQCGGRNGPVIKDEDTIPDWCPLPDEPDEDDKEAKLATTIAHAEKAELKVAQALVRLHTLLDYDKEIGHLFPLERNAILGVIWVLDRGEVKK